VVTKYLVDIGKRVFKPDEIERAYTKMVYPETELKNPVERTAYSMLKVADRIGIMDDLGSIYVETLPLLPKDAPPELVFRRDYLQRKLNRVFDLPDVQVVDFRQPTINVLVPAFDFHSVSAGFFGVFQLARFLRKTGQHVRLVLFDTFVFSEKEARKRLQQYPGMEELFDEVEVDYIGGREQPLYVSPDDYCVATVWYSAYFAEKINNVLGRSKFLYLIQDYETNFYPGSSSFALSDLSYEMNYDAFFSTKALMDLFIKRDIGGFRTRELRGTFFNNACSSTLLDHDRFVELNEAKTKKSLVFYSRPVVDRNMFELTALALIEAYRQGIFNPAEWDCIGMGLGEGEVELAPSVHSIHLPRMPLAEYIEAVSNFDVCLTLMASPHPSLIPMDLGGSGAVVVTNTFATKTPEYLESINKNIIPVTPDLYSIVAGLREAVERCRDIETRWRNAAEMTYPRTWDESLTDAHLDYINQWLAQR